MNLKRDTRVQIVIVENGKYILLKHLVKSENRTFWGLPGGGREEGETDEQAAIREAKEETGLDIRLLPIMFEYLAGKKKFIYDRFVTYLAYPIAGEAATGSEPEAETIENYNYRLLDLKWQDFYDDEGIDPHTKKSLNPIREQLAASPFIRRAGTLVYRNDGDSTRYLTVSAKIDPDCFIFPQGHIDPGESPEETARRETREESGVEVNLEKSIGIYFYENSGKIYQTVIYLASFVSDSPSGEHRQVKWIEYEESKNMNMPRENKRFIRDIHNRFTGNAVSKSRPIAT